MSYLFSTRNCLVGESGRVPFKRYSPSEDVKPTGQVQKLHMQCFILLQLALATYSSTETTLISGLHLPPLSSTDCRLGLCNMKSILHSPVWSYANIIVLKFYSSLFFSHTEFKVVTGLLILDGRSDANQTEIY